MTKFKLEAILDDDGDGLNVDEVIEEVRDNGIGNFPPSCVTEIKVKVFGVPFAEDAEPDNGGGNGG